MTSQYPFHVCPRAAALVLRRSLGLVVCALLLVGCITDLEPEVGEIRAGACRPEDSDPYNDVGFARDIMPLLKRSGFEAGCSCHQPTNGYTAGIDESGLSLGSYAELMRGGNDSAENIVVPGDPCASLIVQKVSSAPPDGQRMPPGGPPFMSPEEIALLRDWIAEGAHDN